MNRPNPSRRPRHTPAVLGTLCLLTLLVGCGGGATGGDAFRLNYPDNRPADISAALGRIQAAPSAPSAPVAVGVGGDPSELYVLDLNDGAVLWSTPATLRSWPHIAGDLVVTHEGDRVIGRDVRNGTERFSFADQGLELTGAASDGHVGAFTLSTSGHMAGDSLLVVTNAGSIAFRHRTHHSMGCPAVAGGMVMVPWATQNMSFFDANSGDEVARVRVRGAVLGHVFAQAGEVYMGQQALYHLDANTTGQAGSYDVAAPHYTLPANLELPGDPPLMLDPYVAPPSPASAAHRVRMAFRAVTAGDAVGMSDGLIYSIFHKTVFALDASTGELRWAAESPRNISGAEALPGGLLLADDQGAVQWLDAADGRERWATSAERQTHVLRFRVEGFSPRLREGEARGSLASQLQSVVETTDAQLVPARLFGLSALEQIPGEDATNHLIEVCSDGRAPLDIRNRACSGLSRRSDGPEAVLRALGRQASYLDDTAAPPVGPLADAARQLGESRATPLLIAHLGDPATRTRDLAPLVRALSAVGADDPATADALEAFVRLYHADAGNVPLAMALDAAADGVFALRGAEAVDVMQALVDDDFTATGLRNKATQLLSRAQSLAAQAAAEEAGEDLEGAAGEGDVTPVRRPPPVDPTVVTSEMALEALAPSLPGIRRCIRDNPPQVSLARLAMVVEPDGRVSTVMVAPRRLQACIEPYVRIRDMPATEASRRQRVRVVIRPE